MTRLLLFLGLFLLVIILLRRLAGAFSPGGGDAGRARRSGGATQLVRDRVCNTYIPRDRALTLGSGEETRYYCSKECCSRDRARSGGGAVVPAP